MMQTVLRKATLRFVSYVSVELEAEHILSRLWGLPSREARDAGLRWSLVLSGFLCMFSAWLYQWQDTVKCRCGLLSDGHVRLRVT